jgi:hypothetical protein
MRYSDVEVYGMVFKGEELDTPILKYYFKSVHLNFVLHSNIKSARNSMGFLK